jgi:hypothetical protein
MTTQGMRRVVQVARKKYKNGGLKASKENTIWETLA